MIKLYICLFWEKHPTQQIAYEAKKPYMGKLSALALFLSAAIVPALGLTPNLTMDKIADIAGGFLNAAAPAHAVHYFSLTNIKGACISLAIGLIVYLLFIRTTLMKRENGVREYVDLWPSWLDIEDRSIARRLAACWSLAAGSRGWAAKRRWKPTCIAR